MGKKYVVRLDESEREMLGGLVKKGRGKVLARKRLHAEILLKADEGPIGPGWTDRRVSEAFDVHLNTVQNIRQRFVEGGMEAALDRKKQLRPSRQRILDGEGEARLIAIACGAAPAGQARWTLRLLASRLVELEVVESISHETVRQRLKKTP